MFPDLFSTRVQWPKEPFPRESGPLYASLGMELLVFLPPILSVSEARDLWRSRPRFGPLGASPSLFRSNSVPFELFTLGGHKEICMKKGCHPISIIKYCTFSPPWENLKTENSTPKWAFLLEIISWLNPLLSSICWAIPHPLLALLRPSEG